jgi:type 1 glutamine amidotransferase
MVGVCFGAAGGTNVENCNISGGGSEGWQTKAVVFGSAGGSTPVPTVTLAANPASVASGGTSTLTWSSTNASSCTASGAWSGTKATSGSQASAALSATSTFTLTCTGAGGSASSSATVAVSGATGSLNFQRVVIDASSPPDPWMKNIADLNGDGLPDLIVSGSAGPVVWYQAPNWTKRTISASANSESGSAVGDINGDGFIDVVVGKTWYENVGGGASWIAHNLPSGSAGTHDIVVADINGDGKPDIIMRGETQSVVTVYLQVSPNSWTVFNVEPGIGLNGLDVADIDGDGFPDIVVGGVWMQNPGANVATTTWTKRTFAPGWHDFAAVKVIDIDRDGLPDIVLSVSEDVGKLSWFKAPANPRTGVWVENVIATGLDHAHGVSVYDIDKDGWLDVVASEYGGAGRLIVYRGNGGTSWTPTELGRDSLHNLHAADIDGDGDIDLFGVYAWGVNPAVLYRNLGVATANRVLVFSKTLGFRHASIPDGIAAIQSLGATNNFIVDATEDSSVFTSANLARYKAIVFLNPSGDILNASQRAAFQLYIQNGGGFVGIHNPNALTLEGWDWYTKLIGARYVSEIANQPSRLQIVDTTHISTQGLPNPWTISFESYNWDVNPKVNGAKVLINLDETSVSGGTMGTDHPFSWYHAYDGGRSWYTVGGADSANYSDANFLRHILGGIKYAGAF